MPTIGGTSIDATELIRLTPPITTTAIASAITRAEIHIGIPKAFLNPSQIVKVAAAGMNNTTPSPKNAA